MTDIVYVCDLCNLSAAIRNDLVRTPVPPKRPAQPDLCRNCHHRAAYLTYCIISLMQDTALPVVTNEPDRTHAFSISAQGFYLWYCDSADTYEVFRPPVLIGIRPSRETMISISNTASPNRLKVPLSLMKYPSITFSIVRSARASNDEKSGTGI